MRDEPPSHCWAEDHCIIQYVFKNHEVLGGLLYEMVAQMPAFGIQLLQTRSINPVLMKN